MRRLHVLPVVILCALAGCSSGMSGGSAAKTGTGGTSSDYVALSQTIFMGDVITQNWPQAASPATAITITEGAAGDFGKFDSKCVTGCSPSALQIAAPNNKRLVILVGEVDALTLCGGGTDADFSFNLSTLVGAAQSLFGLEVWIGTVPPIYSPNNGALTCQTATATINQQIGAVALASGVRVLDFASVLNSSNDFSAKPPVQALEFRTVCPIRLDMRL
jgi:hypothetical protein